MPTMGVLESRFADMIWSHEPLASRELIKMAEEELHWKSTTSYTVLKRLCEREIFRLQDKTVTSLISREEFYGMKSEQFVEETFDGSLPAFIAAFGTRKKLSDEEVEELKKLIDGLRYCSCGFFLEKRRRLFPMRSGGLSFSGCCVRCLSAPVFPCLVYCIRLSWRAAR